VVNLVVWLHVLSGPGWCYVCRTVLTTVTLASSNSALPDDGDYTETGWNSFNVNFKTPFKAILLCISW
jgi:hypothetical protein